MRIVIDMQGAQTESRFRGIGRYTLGFTQGVARNRGGHEVVLALNGLFPETIEPIRAAFHDVLPQENIRVWHVPGPVAGKYPGNETRRETAELVREAFLASLKADVIHVSSLFEGYGDDAISSIRRFDHATPISVSLFDLIPLLNARDYLDPDPRFARYYRRKLGYLKQADSFFAISEFTRQESLAHLGIFEDRVVNVSTAIESCFHPRVIDAAAVSGLYRRLGLTRPFILYTGGGDERKNLTRLIKAYALLPVELRSSHHLVMAGKMPQHIIDGLRYQAKLAGLKPDELHFAGYVSDEELLQLYSLCQLFVFPSWHEGFGLPALEAMACGAPVIGANTSSLPDVIGLEDALFDPFDVASMANKMAQALRDDGFRAMLREHGLKQATVFSWDETAKRAIAAWESLSSPQTRSWPVSLPPNRKPRLAFVSPLPPERTGIADYSAELLPALAEYYDIWVVTAQDKVDDSWVNRHARVRDVAWFRAHADGFDRILYQLGNSSFHRHMLSLLEEAPGTVVLHDFFLSGLISWLEFHADAHGAWTKALYDSHGYGAVCERYRDEEAARKKYPANLRVLQHAQGVIVHSKYSYELHRQWYGESFSDGLSVIPLLRSPAKFDKPAIRRELGFDENDFVVCSFGFLAPTKLNHRLLACWLKSALAGDGQCHLVFVGENYDGEYGAGLSQTIRSGGFESRIRITGFAAPETFRKYLAAADAAVQLRTQSRGETSASVLDCMNHALPTIVNAHGSMADADPESVWMLPDEFEDDELVEALQSLRRDSGKRRALGERARAIILDRHAPAECAKRYAEAIERFHAAAKTSTPALLEAIAEQFADTPPEAELCRISSAVAATLPPPRPAKRLFLDISATCRHDLKTGIERVVRASMLALLQSPPAGYRVEPVYLSNIAGRWRYRFACRYTLALLQCPAEALEDEIVEPECGDILLGLDLSGSLLTQAEEAGLFADYRGKGVAVYFMVYDLLPVFAPEFFPPGAAETHGQWLRAVSRFDGVICISKTVADDFSGWQSTNGFDRTQCRPCRVAWSHLGADIANSAPSRGLPDDADRTLQALEERRSFLMVGTIEPRKGCLEVIQAFDRLWRAGTDINLVIVGKEGWKDLPDDMRRDIPETVETLRAHPELNKRLFWLEGISDEYLEKVYMASTCLIAASHGEGFGLPLIEAARHKLPVIARDIPVFREVAERHAYYFTGDLAHSIETWLTLHARNQHPGSDEMPWLSWRESAERLWNLLTAAG